MSVGFLHPGLMGETLAANCSAHAWWASAGRSDATRVRAEDKHLTDAGTIAEMVKQCDVIVSICPPASAVSVADVVRAAGFAGLYVDANAISPQTARSIGERYDHYVDGSVIGPPAHKPGTTRLYLSGSRANEVADLYRGSALDARVIGIEPGAASALKMAYASWTKIGSALQLAIRALAEAEGVEQALVDEWDLSQPGLVERSERVAEGVAPKAWRFTGEMEHIADAFNQAGLPTGFADGAHEIYARLAGFKDADATTLAPVIAELNRSEIPSSDD